MLFQSLLRTTVLLVEKESFIYKFLSAQKLSNLKILELVYKIPTMYLFFFHFRMFFPHAASNNSQKKHHRPDMISVSSIGATALIVMIYFLACYVTCWYKRQFIGFLFDQPKVILLTYKMLTGPSNMFELPQI